MPSRTALPAAWAMLVAGWAEHLDDAGANLLIDGVHNHAEPNGSYEGVTRMFWSFGGWLSRTERSPIVAWRGQEYDLGRLMRRALLAGTDPAGPAYWGDPASTGGGQPTVESAQVAYAVWQARARVWDRLSPREQRQVADWLVACGEPPQQRWRNNWALFWAVNHAARQALGLPFDREIVDDVVGRYLDDAYCGDGWYDDGPSRGAGHFDDYTLWVFTSHVLAWIDIDQGRHPRRAVELLERVRQLMRHLPFFFAADGAWPEYGRSGSYKFARLGALVWAYRHGAWPHSPGLLRTIVERHIGWYIRRGAIRADGTLRQALTSTGSEAVRETYISTGASYWAMQAFGALWSLADDDPIWSAAPEPLPIETGDVFAVLPEPGWILSGTRESGEIGRFPMHVSHYPEKYAKLAYSTAAPYNAGLGDGRPTPDAMIGIVVDGQVSHRMTNEAAAIGTEGWLRYRHRHELAGAAATFDTIVVPDGDLHLRVHRVVATDGAGSIPVLEGAAALGFDHGDHPRLACDPGRGISGSVSGGHGVAMRVWDACRRARLPRSFADAGTGNVVHARNVIPFAEGEASPGDVLVTTVFLGTAAQAATASFEQRLADAPAVTFDSDGSARVAWRGRVLLIAEP